MRNSKRGECDECDHILKHVTNEITFLSRVTDVITFLTRVANMIRRPSTNNISYSNVFFASKTRGSMSLFRIPELLVYEVREDILKFF